MNPDIAIKEFSSSTYTKKYVVLRKDQDDQVWFKVKGLHPTGVEEVKAAIKNLAQKYPENEFAYCEMTLPADITITNMIAYQDTYNDDIT